MSRVVLGSGIQSIVGSVGNLVFSEAKGVTTLRKKPATVSNPRTRKQQAIRCDVCTMAKWWYKFTDERKALWNEYAKQMRKPLPGTDSKRQGGAGGNNLSYRYLGYLSGYNAFHSVNLILRSAGHTAYVYDAPKNITHPCTLTSFTVFHSTEDHCFRFFWEYDEECVPEGSRVRIWARGKRGRHTTRNQRVVRQAPITDMYQILCMWPYYVSGVTIPPERWPFGDFLFQADVVSPEGGISPKTETVTVWVPPS